MRPRPIKGQLAMLSVSSLGGVTTINIGTPSEKFARVICEGGVTLQIFDFLSKPLYTIIPIIMMLNNTYIFKVLNGLEKMVFTASGKNPKAVEFFSLLTGLRLMVDTSKLSFSELTKFSESVEKTVFSYYRIKENHYAINNYAKKQIQFIPDLLHSMQDSDDAVVFELFKDGDSSFADLKSAMFKISNESFYEVSSEELSDVVSLVAQFLKVRKALRATRVRPPSPTSQWGQMVDSICGTAT